MLYSLLFLLQQKQKQNGIVPVMSEANTWDAISSWLTPTVLFCVLNLVVATIFVTSSFKRTKIQEQNRPCEDDHMVQLFRAPSLLEHVKSLSFSRDRAERPDPFHAETRFAEPKGEHPEKLQGMKDGVDDKGEVEADVARSVSEEVPAELEKSESVNTAVVVEERKGEWDGTGLFGEDEAVDAKADDFINRFKQQLKLQRIDSLLRYRRK